MVEKPDTYAFPHPGSLYENGNVAFYPELGMTLRDYFAAKALNGILASGDFLSPEGLFTGGGAAVQAQAAYMLADAMLKARTTPDTAS